MSRTLLGIGIACVVGAIVGGGLTALEIEIPIIESLARQLLLAGFGIILILIAVAIEAPILMRYLGPGGFIIILILGALWVYGDVDNGDGSGVDIVASLPSPTVDPSALESAATIPVAEPTATYTPTDTPSPTDKPTATYTPTKITPPTDLPTATYTPTNTPSPTPPLPNAEYFVGNWINQNSDTSGITRVEISRRLNNLVIQIWGACTPTDCYWGTESIDVSDSNDGILSIMWVFSFKVVDQQISVLPDGRLQVVGHTYFTDNSGRPDTEITYFFVRE